jgi:hypothetical protein
LDGTMATFGESTLRNPTAAVPTLTWYDEPAVFKPKRVSMSNLDRAWWRKPKNSV